MVVVYVPVAVDGDEKAYHEPQPKVLAPQRLRRPADFKAATARGSRRMKSSIRSLRFAEQASPRRLAPRGPT